MDLKVFIPTMARVDRQVTLSRMPDKLQKQAFLVCPPTEAMAHRTNGVKATILPCKEAGITATREWILNYARKQGFKRIVMIDDDVVLQIRRKDMRITNAELLEYSAAFEWLDRKLKVHAHASWGTRFLAYDAPGEEIIGGRAMYALGYNIDMVTKAKASFTKHLPPMPTMEDFNITLQLLKAGLPNAISLKYRASPYASNAPGGCSTWRTIQRHNASAKNLAKAHAPFVKLREADTDWLVDEKTKAKRLEVTVYWQKALKSAEVRG